MSVSIKQICYISRSWIFACRSRVWSHCLISYGLALAFSPPGRLLNSVKNGVVVMKPPRRLLELSPAKAGGFDQRCGTRSAGSESSPCLQFDLPRPRPRLMGLDGMNYETMKPHLFSPAWDVDPINICLSRIRAARTWAPPWARWHAPSVARMMTRLGFSWVCDIPWEVGGLVQYLISKWMLELYANWI